ncbi:MAG: hypothetical protein IT440_06415 [Phycisphaeraceae bacterium]|nr:hypothetical protein [Phycisphaeraceae bacterium]
MATLRWLGEAASVAQVTTVTVGGTVGSETFTLTVGGVELTCEAGASDTASVVAAAIRDAWNASTHPYFAAVSAMADAEVVTLTADVAGVPFVVSASATGIATLTVATPTPSAGPHDWSSAGNWSTGNVPADGDTVILEHTSQPLVWGLDQSSVTLAALRIGRSFTGVLGLPESVFALDHETVSEQCREYRTASLKIGATKVVIGQIIGGSDAVGAGRIRLDTGAAQTELLVLHTAESGVDGSLPPVRWIGSHADNVVIVTRGRVGLAVDHGDDAATVSALHVGQQGRRAIDAHVEVGAGVALTTLHQAGGQIAMACGVATLRQTGGTLTILGEGAVGSATVGGVATFNTGGDVTSLTVTAGGVADFSQDPRDRQVSACRLHAAAALRLDNGHVLSVSFPAGVDLVGCRLADCAIDFGAHVRLNVAAITA